MKIMTSKISTLGNTNLSWGGSLCGFLLIHGIKAGGGVGNCFILCFWVENQKEREAKKRGIYSDSSLIFKKRETAPPVHLRCGLYNLIN